MTDEMLERMENWLFRYRECESSVQLAALADEAADMFDELVR